MSQFLICFEQRFFSVSNFEVRRRSETIQDAKTLIISKPFKIFVIVFCHIYISEERVIVRKLKTDLFFQ
jgi:hypothetical protein